MRTVFASSVAAAAVFSLGTHGSAISGRFTLANSPELNWLINTCGTNTTLYFGGSNSPWSLVDAEQAFNSTSGITTYLGNLTTDTVPLSDGTFGCAAFQANGSDFEYVLGTSNVKSMACPTAIDNFGTSSSYTLSKTSECGAAPSPSPGASPASPLYGIYRLTDEDDDGSTMVVTSTICADRARGVNMEDGELEYDVTYSSVEVISAQVGFTSLKFSGWSCSPAGGSGCEQESTARTVCATIAKTADGGANDYRLQRSLDANNCPTRAATLQGGEFTRIGDCPGGSGAVASAAAAGSGILAAMAVVLAVVGSTAQD